MSGPRMLFDSYVSGGLGELKKLVHNEVETGIQDFKLFNSTNPNNWGKDDKKSLSEALSGFANSQGGVIVWGVDCRKANDVDVVQGLPGMRNLKAVLAQMETLTAQLVSPAIVGVEHKPIVDTTGGDSGYIVSYVPQGESGPHMAMTGHKYMYRSGNSFLPMEHWMVANSFARRRKPELKLSWEPYSVSNEAGGDYAWLRLLITNDGRGTAQYPGFVLFDSDSFSPSTLMTGDTRETFRWEANAERILGDAYQGVVIVTKRSLLIGVLKVKLPARDIHVPYELSCDEFYSKGEYVIKGREINQAGGQRS